MITGIVGHEAAKFTPETEKKARDIIRGFIKESKMVISGGCHLGGIDIWAIEEAKKLGIPTCEYLPQVLTWENGYKKRNIKIAEIADQILVVVVRTLPENFKGPRYEYCYHCDTRGHVKSGGCWTGRYAFEKLGKPWITAVV